MSADKSRPISLMRALEGVLSSNSFPYASNGRLFRDGEFGRDSLETAEDLLQLRPDVAHAVILRLAELQGRRVDPSTGEEPGKIHHEYRAVVMNGRPIGPESMKIFRALAKEWHLAETDTQLDALKDLVNYFTIDATPLYVRLVARYCERYGDTILDVRYVPQRPDASQVEQELLTIRDSIDAAVEWVASKVERSDIGLLEWERKTPWEHRFQAWKDGGTSYLHDDGNFVNYNGPVASIEVQGLAHDALLAALTLGAGDLPRNRERYLTLASRLRETTLQRFWMPEREYFAMALDRDPETGAVRQVRPLTSNGAAVLDSSLFDDLPAAQWERYVIPTVKRVFDKEFLTPVGIRCTSLLYADLQDYPAYQSSYTVWHKETYDIAKGQRRQGFPCLASELERRLLNAINLAGPREFMYVMPDNRMDYGPARKGSDAEVIEIAATNHPENDQAWTVAAGLDCKWRVGHGAAEQVPDRHHDLEEEILRRSGTTSLFRTTSEIERGRDREYVFRVNTDLGWSRERAWFAAHNP